MFHVSSSGPHRCIKDPKVKVAIKKAKVTVKVIVTPNLKKCMKVQVSKKIPLPMVVMYPLKMLVPICLYDCYIFKSLVSSLEWM